MQMRLLVFAVVVGLCNAGPGGLQQQQHQHQQQPRITAAFASISSRHGRTHKIHTRSHGSYPLRHRAMMPVNLQNRLKRNFIAPPSTTNNMMMMPASSADAHDSFSSSIPVVVRLAAKPFDSSSSKPSSREYTTRKVEVSNVRVTMEGCHGDYNHYRTLALKSTKDRAVSLLSEDVLNALRFEYEHYNIQDGDLGENVYVAGASFQFFRIGERYEFMSPDDDNGGYDSSTTNYSQSKEESVILEITEKMTPCANLCKLPYINQDSLDPKERISRCREFLAFLDRYDGYRGWYAKVVREGFIHRGSIVRHLSS